MVPLPAVFGFLQMDRDGVVSLVRPHPPAIQCDGNTPRLPPKPHRQIPITTIANTGEEVRDRKFDSSACPLVWRSIFVFLGNVRDVG